MNPYNKNLVKWLVLLFLILISIHADAQADQRYDLRGVVVDSGTQKPLVAVTLSLLDAKGALIHTRTTGTDGAFVFVLSQGKQYSLAISAVGFKKRVLDAASSTLR